MTSVCEIESLKVTYSVAGSGPPLLLMHGYEASHQMFDELTPLLASHFLVVAYDQRDCGTTQNLERPTSLVELAQDAASLLRALGIPRAHVYGTSFGGRVAQAMAILHPAAVDRLILSSTWPLPDALADLNADGVREIMALRSDLPSSADKLAEYFFPSSYLATHPQRKDLFSNVNPSNPRSLRRGAVLGDCPPLPPRSISHPTLLLAGQLDRIVPPAVTLALGAAIANSKCVVMASVGHVSAMQAPDLVASHIKAFCPQDH